jgi:hypothetical protein
MPAHIVTQTTVHHASMQVLSGQLSLPKLSQSFPHYLQRK